MLLVHGYGTSNHLLELAGTFACKGIRCFLFDLPGFGYSGGKWYNPNFKEVFKTIT